MKRVILEYFVILFLIVSVLGLPIVIGYLSSIISKRMTRADFSDDSLVLGSFTPVIRRYLDGLSFMLVYSIPFLFAYSVQGSYAWIVFLSNIAVTSPISLLLSVVALLLSFIGIYSLPFFATIQSYKQSYDMTFSDVIAETMLQNLYSKKYFIQFIKFLVLLIAVSFLQALGQFNIFLGLVFFLSLPVIVMMMANVIGRGAVSLGFVDQEGENTDSFGE